jgi:hypothetical protein
LSTDDAPGLTNGSRLPFFVMMNCLNGFFHGLFPEESLAEALMRAANGGAVAVWASSGFTEPDGQVPMNRALLELLFEKKYATVGEAVAASKATSDDIDVRRTWIFFGDPAMRLKGIAAPSRRRTETETPDRVPASGPPSSGDRLVDEAPAAPAFSAPVVRLADWNGDGRDDVFLYAAETWTIVFSATTGDRVRSGVWDRAWEVYPARLNGDRAEDLVLFDRTSGSVAQAINDGTGNFQMTTGVLGLDWELQIADLDGNNVQDVLLTVPAYGVWSTALSDGRGHFTYRPGEWPASSTVTPGDFNGDGRADAFLYDPANGASTLAFNNGLGGFTDVSGTSGTGWLVQRTNLDGDARADLLFYNPETGRWSACTVGDAGTFMCRAGLWTPGLDVILLKGARRDDVLLYNPVTGEWTLTVNNGSAPISTTGFWAPDLTIGSGDLDGDGRTDLFLYESATGDWSTALARGAGRFDYSSGHWGPGWSMAGRP